MKQPFLDLKAQYKNIKSEIKQVIDEILESQRFILGRYVAKLEEQIKNYIGVKHAIGVSSGTDAILVTLMALGIKSGDEVITTPFTFFATAGCIARVGARPVFVDVEPLSFNIDPKLIEGEITPRTKAIIVVHLFGQPADMELIVDICQRYNLVLIEDCAQAIGAKYQDKNVASMGKAGCFSFFPSKNLGGYGDGGMVVTNDDELADKIRSLRVHGESQRYYYKYIGGNFRLDEIQAGVLSVKFKYIDEWNKQRREKADVYNKLFREYKLTEFIKTPEEIAGRYHVYHQYVIRAHEREILRQFLTQQEIETAIYYPLPLHLQECFGYLGYKEGDFPEAERASKEVLALPIYPELELWQQEHIVQQVRNFYK